MKHVSLFTGVGMLDRAAEAFGYRTVATAEVDPFARSVLHRRFPDALHFEDVRHVSVMDDQLRHALAGGLDLLSGGFPCQDLSPAGTGAGLAGERSGLWREFARVIRELKPSRILIENVAALRSRGLHVLLNDLHHLGYDAQWDCIPAAAVGAPHMRDRMWIVATLRTPDDNATMGRNAVGLVGPRGDGVLDFDGNAITKLSRAGSLMRGVVSSRESYTQSAVRKSAGRKLLPTPTRSDGSGGPGTTPKREGGKNLRTVAAELYGGALHPEYVEWMMGLPRGWTDPDVPNDALIPFPGWQPEPRDIPMTVASRGQVKHRAKRIRALGNGLVPAAAARALLELSPES